MQENQIGVKIVGSLEHRPVLNARLLVTTFQDTERLLLFSWVCGKVSVNMRITCGRWFVVTALSLVGEPDAAHS